MEPITAYARIGIVHHMLYPESMLNDDEHERTLTAMLSRRDIETLDISAPYSDTHRKRMIDVFSKSTMERWYSNCQVPTRKIAPGSPLPNEQAIVRMAIADQLNIAKSLGAEGYSFGPGADAPTNEDRPKWRKAFKEFCVWMSRETKARGMRLAMEPHDFDVDKRCIYGSTESCVALIHDLVKDGAAMGLQIDISHVPLVHEDIAFAIRTAGKHIERVHLANCVLKDRTSPWFGDKHPPIGFPGGEIHTPQLAIALAELLQIGYLSKGKRGSLVFEINPYPGKTAEETFADNMNRLNEAWKSVR